MTRFNSRAKGCRFERELCDIMKRWSGRPFQRVPLSGGWAKNVLTGDITTVDDGPEIPYSIEAKHVEGWGWVDLLCLNPSSPILGFWKQATEDGAKRKKTPILFLKQNRKPLLVGIPYGATIYVERKVLREVRVDLCDLPCLAIFPAESLTSLPYPAFLAACEDYNQGVYGEKTRCGPSSE